MRWEGAVAARRCPAADGEAVGGAACVSEISNALGSSLMLPLALRALPSVWVPGQQTAESGLGGQCRPVPLPVTTGAGKGTCLLQGDCCERCGGCLVCSDPQCAGLIIASPQGSACFRPPSPHALFSVSLQAAAPASLLPAHLLPLTSPLAPLLESHLFPQLQREMLSTHLQSRPSQPSRRSRSPHSCPPRPSPTALSVRAGGAGRG